AKKNPDVVADQKGTSEYSTRAGRFVYGQESLSNVKNQNTIPTTVIGSWSPNGENWLTPWLHRKTQEEVVAIGPWNALWVKPEPARQRLIVARLVRVGTQQVCQGILLDWDALKKDLAAEVRDVFPGARFKPVTHDPGAVLEANAFPPHPERTMASLPVELDLGPLPALPDPGWTPLRIGLALA